MFMILIELQTHNFLVVKRISEDVALCVLHPR